jgi:hypothetical protein
MSSPVAYVLPAFPLIMQTTTRFVNSTHIRTIPSARFFVDANNITQRYFFGALARRFLYTI